MLQRWLQHPCPASWRETGDVGSKTVRKTSCISHIHVLLMVFLGGYETHHSQTSWHCQKKTFRFFRSPKEISPAVPMECAEHPIATPRTKGEDLAEHISSNQEGYRVSEWCFRGCGDDLLLKCCYCDCFGLLASNTSSILGCPLTVGEVPHGAKTNHAMSHARKTGKAFKRLLPKEAPIHLGRPAHITENINHWNMVLWTLQTLHVQWKSMSQYTTIYHSIVEPTNQKHLIYPVTQWSESMQQPALGRILGQSPGENTMPRRVMDFHYKTRFDIQGIGMNL